MFEIRSKAQFKSILKQMASRGGLDKKNIADIMSKIILPEIEGVRKGKVRESLGGYKSDYRRGKSRKGTMR